MSDYTELGTTGLDTFAGQIRAEFLQDLRGKEGVKRYSEMRLNSPIVGAMLAAIEYAIRRIAWTFESDEGADDERLDLLNDARDAMTTSWNDHISEALTMLAYGWALFEVVYQRGEDGRILWRKFGIRGQDTLYKWEFSPEGGLSAFWQTASPFYQPVRIPIEKCLLYRTRVERNNPEGRSILRTAWTSYYYAKGIQQIEAIGVERDLAGMAVITLPASASKDDEAKAKKLVRNIRRDEQEGIVLPSPEWKLELMSTGGSRQFDTDRIVNRYEARILMSALAQFLLLGQQNVGSLALSRDQTDFFNMAVDSIADQIAAVITQYAIPRLCKLNGMDPVGLKLGHSPAGDPDIAGMGQFLAQMQPYITWFPQDEVWLRALAKLPTVDPEEIEAERERKAQEAIALMQRTGGQAMQDDNGGDRRDSRDDEPGERPDRRSRMRAEPVQAQTLGDLLDILRSAQT